MCVEENSIEVIKIVNTWTPNGERKSAKEKNKDSLQYTKYKRQNYAEVWRSSGREVPPFVLSVLVSWRGGGKLL
jgi:hypothetical protein